MIALRKTPHLLVRGAAPAALLLLSLLLQGSYFEWEFSVALLALSAWAYLNSRDITQSLRTRPAVGVAFVLAVLYALSCFWAVTLRGALLETLKAVSCATVFAAFSLESNARSPRILIAAPTITVGTVSAAIGIMAMDGLEVFPAAAQQGRLASLFQYANAAGIAAAVSVLASLALWVDSREGSGRRPIALMAGTTSAFSLLMTLSRGAWVALAAALVLWLALIALLRAQRPGFLAEAVSFLMGCSVSTAVSFAALTLLQVRGIVASHVFGALAGCGVALAFCLADLASTKRRLLQVVAAAMTVLVVTSLNMGVFGVRLSLSAQAAAEYVVKPGDTLTSIGQGLSEPVSGTEVYSLNRDRIDDPQNLEAGLTLLVPVRPSGVEKIGTRVSSISLSTPSFEYRKLGWKDAIEVVVRHPFGLGGGGWESAYKSLQTTLYRTKDIHSALLDLALNTGFPGLALFATSLILVGVRYLRLWRTGRAGVWQATCLAIAAALLTQGAVDLTFHFAGFALLFWGCLGVASSSDPLPDTSTPRRRPARVCQGLYLVCGFTAACLVAGTVANNLGRLALGAEPKRASGLFAMAAGVDPLNARYRRDQAVALMVTSGRSAEADSRIRELLLDAIRLEPANPVYRGDLGLFALAQGRYDEAVALLSQAVDRHRFSAYWRTKLLQALNAQAAYEVAWKSTSVPEILSAADRTWAELIGMEWAIGQPSKDAILERAKMLVLAGRREEAKAILDALESEP